MFISEIDASGFEDFDRHEKIVGCVDEESGLKAFIAIHNRNLGPALGGCRYWSYADEQDAIKDVLRLSRGMTYKSAIAELALGGGKAVIMGSPEQKHPGLYRAMGRFIESLGGDYITAEDAGTSASDLREVAKETSHVMGIGEKRCADGSVVDGDPSPSTAYGVFVGIKAAVRHRFGVDDLKDVRVAVQGVGNVGRRLVKLLVQDGAKVLVSDIFDNTARKVGAGTGATVADNHTIYTADVDVFAPCALGGAISMDSLANLRAPIIAGAANNQLADQQAGHELYRLGKTYAPDYVINAGGIVDIHYERIGYDHKRVIEHIQRLARTLELIFTLSHRQGVPTHIIADRIAEKRFLSRVSRQVA